MYVHSTLPWEQQKGCHMQCSMRDCENASVAKGLCSGHYQMALRGEALRPLRSKSMPKEHGVVRAFVPQQTLQRLTAIANDGKERAAFVVHAIESALNRIEGQRRRRAGA